MKKNIFFLLFLFYGIINIRAQERLDSIPPSGDDIIHQGIELFDNGKYEEAVSTYLKVNACDPSYVLACYEMALSYDNLGNYQMAIQKCQEALDLDPSDIQFCILKGSLLDEADRREEAIDWLVRLDKICPYNQSLIYNLAICYLNNGDLQKAEELLIRGLYINPYHTSSHMALARINYIMGRTAQAYLAYNMGILMNPGIDNIRLFENTITGQIDSLQKSYLYQYPGNFAHKKWDDLTGLLNAEIAFRPDFQYGYKLDYLICRQSYLLFREMGFDENDTTFYNQFYVRFFRQLFDNNEFETYIYYIFKGVDNKKVSEWLQKSPGVIDKFVDYARKTIESWKEYGFSTAKEAEHHRIFHYNDNGGLESVGKLIGLAQPSREGMWYFVSETGTISQEVNYRNNLKEGESLLYWPDGKLWQKLNFREDKLDGMNYTYYPNGVTSGIYPRKNDIPDGIEEKFNSAGKLISRQTYKNGTVEGNSVSVDYINGFSSEVPFINNKREGTMTEKWLNGNKKTEAAYSDSLLNGIYKKWYANGKREWEGNYSNNEQAGKWTSYYPNGIKSAEGTCDEKGNSVGSYSEFNREGKLSIQISGYRDGKPDGTQIFYFPDGKVQSSIVMDEGRMKHIDCFSISGEKLYAADEMDSVFDYRFFYPEGVLKTEGKFVCGLREGIWKGFNVLGQLTSEESWSKGAQNGQQKYYYTNGNPRLVYVCDSGKIIGKVSRYFSSGQVSLVGYYNAEGPTGEWTSYYSNDSVESRSCYSGGKLTGRRIGYSPAGKITTEELFNADGEQIRIKYYNDQGKLTDDLNFPYDSVGFTLHFPNGKVRAKLYVCDRRNNGVQEYYFPNGQIKSTQNFIYGNADGKAREWDYNGEPVRSRDYCMDNLQGDWLEYESGKLIFSSPFQMNENNGLYREFHPNGHLFRSFYNEDGLREGNSDCFAPDSTWMFSLGYRDDEICSVSYIDKQGKLHSNEQVDKSTATITCYFKDGKVAALLPFNGGIFNGKYSIFYSNGKLLRELNFVNDYREGTATYYYENGDMKESCDWKNGDKDGHYISYYPNGTRKMEGNYLANKKQGEWLVYDEGGNQKETLFYANDELYEIK